MLTSSCSRTFQCLVTLLVALVPAASSAAAEFEIGYGTEIPVEDSALTLLQVSAQHVNNKETSCSPLENRGSYFTVGLNVGTPPQRFEVVADTGSDAVIIPSCLCQERGHCQKSDRCFHGTNKSTTFRIQEAMPLVSMEFGSGTITSALATDFVKAGTVQANMSQGLLLMLDRDLDIRGQFEGILGLGQLQAEYNGQLLEAGGDQPDWDKPPQDPHHAAAPKKKRKRVEIPGFLRKSRVDRFSICFNDGSQPGVLRLNSPRMDDLLPSVGSMHWGLDFNGISVGTAHHQALFCGTPGEQCGAIPDSGTTLMMGPEKQVRSVLAAVCDNWPRCVDARAAGPLKGRRREDTFVNLLLQCESWLDRPTGKGLDELPSIFLHLPGPEKNETLELSPWSYIFQAIGADIQENLKMLGTLRPWDADLHAAASNYSCTVAFGSSEMSSGGMDDVWIIGTPLFYEFVVNYDLSTHPPSMGFSREICGSCGKEAASLLSTVRDVRDNAEARRRPRRIKGPVRIGRRRHPRKSWNMRRGIAIK